MSRVGVVVVRYGAGITGGAEAHARQVAERLAARGHDVTVLTTCADDYVSWANSLPPGESRDGPVRVLRFPVRAERDMARFDAAIAPLLRGHATRDEEERLLVDQGPDCPALLDHLREHAGDLDAVVFFTLLYAPTVQGLPLIPGRGILVPTLHDEATVRTSVHGEAIRHAAFVMWNTPEERDLATRLYGVPDLPGAVAGVGVEPPVDLDAGTARARHGLDRPYLLYAGRIDTEKGCGELVRHLLAWARDDDRPLLALAGRAWMPIPDSPRIRHLGFVSEEDRWALMAGAAAVVVPSRLESLSLVALEAMAVGTPVLVRAGSPVLEGHARRSAAGLVYADLPEFVEAASRLLAEPRLRDALGADGRRYVAANYTWDRVLALYDAALARVTADGDG